MPDFQPENTINAVGQTDKGLSLRIHLFQAVPTMRTCSTGGGALAEMAVGHHFEKIGVDFAVINVMHVNTLLAGCFMPGKPGARQYMQNC
jgi:hypothetical protein